MNFLTFVHEKNESDKSEKDYQMCDDDGDDRLM